MALDTGMRPEEILRVRWENVHFEPAGNARFGYIHNPFGKSPRAKRNLPMTARVRELLEDRHRHRNGARRGWAFPGFASIEKHITYSASKGRHDRTLARLSDMPHFPPTICVIHS